MGFFGLSTKKDVEKMLESFGDELRRRDAGWVSLTDVKGSNTDINETGRNKMHEKAREAFFFSPAGKRMVRYVTSYIMGKDFGISSDIEAVQFIIDSFAKSPLNRWSRQLKEWSNRLQTDGEVFATFHLQAFDLPIARETNPYEIKDILTDPDDITRPIVYKRIYESITYKGGIATTKAITEYIPDINASEDDIAKVDLTNSELLNINKRIHQIKTVTYSDRKRGLSDFSAILYYLSRMRNNIDNGLKLNKLREAYYLDVEVDGGSAEVNAEAAKEAYRKPPKSGSSFFHNKKVKINLLQPKIAQKSDDKSMEHVLGQIVMGSGMPEWMLVGQANMYKAGAQEQSAPYVKLIEDYQELWGNEMIIIFTFLVRVMLSFNGDRNLLSGTSGMKGLLSQIDKDEMVEETVLDKNGKMVAAKYENGEPKRKYFWEAVTVNFPEIISRDDNKEADAITKDIGNGLVSKKTAAIKRGYDYDEEKIQMDLERADAIANDPLAQTMIDGVPDNIDDDTDEGDADDNTSNDDQDQAR